MTHVILNRTPTRSVSMSPAHGPPPPPPHLSSQEDSTVPSTQAQVFDLLFFPVQSCHNQQRALSSPVTSSWAKHSLPNSSLLPYPSKQANQQSVPLLKNLLLIPPWKWTSGTENDEQEEVGGSPQLSKALPDYSLTSSFLHGWQELLPVSIGDWENL